jgi:DNA-binding MarR family transcriptional regulator
VGEVAPSDRYGFAFVLLLAGAFRAVINRLHAELAQNGHPDARPAHGFALQAIGPRGVTISELGRRLGISKQAAAKTARGLEVLGYVARQDDPDDARATLLRRTPLANELLRLSAEFFEREQRHWIDTLGEERFRAFVRDLDTISAGARIGDFAGWLR